MNGDRFVDRVNSLFRSLLANSELRSVSLERSSARWAANKCLASTLNICYSRLVSLMPRRRTLDVLVYSAAKLHFANFGLLFETGFFTGPTNNPSNNLVDLLTLFLWLTICNYLACYSYLYSYSYSYIFIYSFFYMI